MFPPLGQRLFYLKVNLKKALNIGCVPCLTPQDSPWRDNVYESGWCHSLSHNFSLYFLHSRISCSVISELYCPTAEGFSISTLAHWGCLVSSPLFSDLHMDFPNFISIFYITQFEKKSLHTACCHMLVALFYHLQHRSCCLLPMVAMSQHNRALGWLWSLAHNSNRRRRGRKGP